VTLSHVQCRDGHSCYAVHTDVAKVTICDCLDAVHVTVLASVTLARYHRRVSTCGQSNMRSYGIMKLPQFQLQCCKDGSLMPRLTDAHQGWIRLVTCSDVSGCQMDVLRGGILPKNCKG